MSARLSVMLDAAPRQLRASAPALATLSSLRCRGRAHRHQLVRQNVSAAARSGSESPGENVVGAASKAAPALLFDVAGSRSTASPRASVAPAPAISPAAALSSPAALAAGGALLAASAATAKLLLDKPSRPYEPGSVGREYDAWTAEGILEYYWGACALLVCRFTSGCLLTANLRANAALSLFCVAQGSTSTWATTQTRFAMSLRLVRRTSLLRHHS